MFKIFFTIIVLILINQNNFSQEVPPLITDRPDQTESAAVVPVNHLQIETGFLFQNENEFTSTFNIAGTLLRYGVADILELRAGAGYNLQNFEMNGVDNSVSGIGGIGLGAKVILIKNNESLPDLGLLGSVTLPAGNENFSPESAEPKLLIVASNSITDKVSIGYNLGGSYISSIEEIIYHYTVALGLSVTERLSTFLEYYGSLSESLAPNKYVDFGFTYLLKDNVQLDASGGLNTNNSENWFVSGGVSFRLPE